MMNRLGQIRYIDVTSKLVHYLEKVSKSRTLSEHFPAAPN